MRHVLNAIAIRPATEEAGRCSTLESSCRGQSIEDDPNSAEHDPGGKGGKRFLQVLYS